MLLVNPESTFRLLSLSVNRHAVLGDISLVFDNDYLRQGFFPEDIYTTVIIGTNGIGKTFLLKVIVDIFNYLYDLNNRSTSPRSLGYSFDIEYWYNDQKFRVKDNAGERNVRKNARVIDKLSCFINGHSVGLNACLLPNVVIASAMTVSDKFPVKTEGEMYHYQGIRNENSPSTTGTRTLIRKTVEGLIKCLKVKGGYREELGILLDVLGFQHTLKILYQIKYKQVLLRDDMNPQLLCEIIDNPGNKYFKRETDLWGKRYFDKEVRGDVSKLEIISEFYRNLYKKLDINRSRLSIVYDVFDRDIEQDAEALLLLSKLDLLSFPTLLVSKQEQYDFVYSSSGETHLLCQMIGIMSDIKKGGVVLIDEPETSSHPNWQIQYIGWLKRIFREYRSCHFIISTHSHFLLSDLTPKTSTIIALEKNKENGCLTNIGEGLNTFCWSTDDILYRVFHVRNTRNFVFEGKVMSLYKMVSNREEKSKVNALLEELSTYQLNEDDPLLRLMKIAKQYVESF